jgi:hypothetical protein
LIRLGEISHRGRIHPARTLRRHHRDSVQNVANGGHPHGELGYATAWLAYQLRADATAADAFTGASPELPSNGNWPESAAEPD